MGLIPRGHRRSLGRGRGTEVVYPDDMAERCRRVAERMRRGQPWQVVALSLFGAGADLPEEAVRGAYRWALHMEVPADEDELDTAERGVGHLLATTAGRRLQALVAAHVKRSGVARGEPPNAVARSVLTNLFLIQLGGEVANDEAMIELLTGMGLPVAELPPNERIQVARLMGAVMDAFSFGDLVDVAEVAPIEDLRSAIPIASQLLEMLPAELRALVPKPVAELLPEVLAPLVVQLGRLVAGQLADIQAPGQPAAGSLSQRPATMGPMPLPRTPGPAEPEARSA